MERPKLGSYASGAPDAARLAGIPKAATTHTLGRTFATHLVESGHDIRTMPELMGHADVKTRMIDMHV